MLKKIVAVGMAMFLWATALSSTAAAQPVEPFEVEFSFEDINPCTGELHVISFSLVIRERIQKNGNLVAQVKRSGTTSDGYTLVNGTEAVVGNKNNFNTRFMDRWAGADGSKIQARGSFGFNERTGEVRRDTFVLRCIDKKR